MTPMEVIQSICTDSCGGAYPKFIMLEDCEGVIANLTFLGISVYSEGPDKEEVLKNIIQHFVQNLAFVVGGGVI